VIKHYLYDGNDKFYWVFLSFELFIFARKKIGQCMTRYIVKRETALIVN
jgi:hypothetical protein